MNNFDADMIKYHVSPTEFYSHELPSVQFKRHGWNDGGLCPFHDDNHKGSFRVDLETGAFKCFACGASGSDVIAFTMALHGLQFIEALAHLVDEWRLI